ncbi:MAG TPA: serine/threonine-protein kinase [Gemmata sp.]|jgi:serine/threonine protein kinase|nr:serine/threonine-protein kinase [Gemmata sp.]
MLVFPVDLFVNPLDNLSVTHPDIPGSLNHFILKNSVGVSVADGNKTDCSSCPTMVELAAFLRGELVHADRDTIGRHLASCDKCGTVVRQIGSGQPAEANTFRISKTKQATDHSFPEPVNSVPNAVLEPQVSSNSTASFLLKPTDRQIVRLPRQLGQYRLQEEIGAGGMGTVYRAEHLHLKKHVAVKLLSPERVSDSAALTRFRREMEVVGRLDHPNIVRATDAGEIDSIHYLVMEFIDGLNLTQLVRRHGPIPVPEACELIRQAALGLQHAHENGLVHRDIKPQNLMLTSKGEVKVLDLGLALLHAERFSLGGLTGSGQVMGTADYMAPEQWENCHGVDIRADMYSLGCTLYFLLTGRPPFGSPGYESIVRKMAAHLRDDPFALQPDVGKTSEFLARMLAKEPANRPQTPDEVVRELAPLSTGANLIGLHETAARSKKTDDEATWSHVPDNRPPSTISSAPATVSLNLPHGRKRWRRWAIAGAVLLVCAIAVTLNWSSLTYRDHQASEQSTSTPSASNAVSTVPASQDSNAWVMLLKKKPEERLWPQPSDSHWSHDPQRETLAIQAYRTTLIRLGEATKPDYRLQIGFRQPKWEGGIGLYIGGHTDKNDGKFHFQVIHLQQPDGKFMLARSRGSLEQIPPPVGGIGAATVGFASETLKRPLTAREYLLEIEVKSPGGVSWMNIRWDGDPYSDLTSAKFKSKVDNADFHGEFGIFCQSTSTTVTTARLLQSP